MSPLECYFTRFYIALLLADFALQKLCERHSVNGSRPWCREEGLPLHPEPWPCSTATPRPHKPRVASAASVPRAHASKKQQSGEAPAQDMEPAGVAWGLQLPQASLTRGHPLAHLGCPWSWSSPPPWQLHGYRESRRWFPSSNTSLRSTSATCSA